MTMKKMGVIALTVVGVIFAYIILTAGMPAIVDIVSTANATANITSFEGLQGGLVSMPLWIYFLPALIGGVIIAIVIKA